MSSSIICLDGFTAKLINAKLKIFLLIGLKIVYFFEAKTKNYPNFLVKYPNSAVVKNVNEL